MKKLYFSVVLSLVILGCSHTRDGLDLFGKGRIQVTQNEYKKPDFFLDKSAKFSQAGRAPASVNTENIAHLSNRQIYFLNSYVFYKTYASALEVGEELKSCPNFHDLVLKEELSKKMISKIKLEPNFLPVKSDERLAAHYPVLALPYSESSDLYTELVKQEWKNADEHFKHALSVHFQNTKEELDELCETGVSPGYYIYENLVTYFKQESSFHRTQDGLKALLKVPVIANMLIVDSLVSDYKINPAQKYNSWLLSRSNTSWIREYFSSLKEKRGNRLSKKID